MPIPPRRKTSYTGALEDPIVRFTAELARAVQFHRLYPPNHPYVKKAAGAAIAACEIALNKKNPFTIGASEIGFFIEGELMPDIPVTVTELGKAFLRINVHSITVSRGVTEDEVRAFVVKLGELETAAVQGSVGEGAIVELSRSAPHIDVDMFSYEKVLSKEGELLEKVKHVSAETGEDGLALLDKLLDGGSELGDTDGKLLAEAAAWNPGEVAALLMKGMTEVVSASGKDGESLARAGGLINLDAAGSGDAGLEELQSRVVGFFDKVGSAMTAHKGATLGEVRKTLGAIVSFMPESTQKMLFGKVAGEGEEIDFDSLMGGLPQKSKAALVFNEMLSGDSTAEELRQEFSMLAERGSELAAIVDSVVDKARELGTHESTDKIISRLSAALQTGIRAEVFLRGTIAVVDPDLDTAAEYRAKLAQKGFQVDIFIDGAEALEKIRHSPPGLLITEIKLHGASGIELMNALRRMPETVPVIIVTAYPSFDGDFEIATYPQHAFFTKPVETDAVVQKVCEYFPEKAAQEPALGAGADGKTHVDTEELDNAHELQLSLLPDTLPDIEGFDISVHYSACKEVGGDYYDVVPQGEDSWCFVLADVSGKGVPAAMVMVMVRSLAQLCLPSCESPRDGIIELNRMVSKQIIPGLFVSAICVRIEPRTRTVTLCSAGQCPAAMWIPGREKPEVFLLKHTGVVMGLGDTSYFREGTKEQVLQFEPGAGVMVYTDGVIEAMNRQRKEFGTRRLSNLIRNTTQMETREINKALRAAVDAFSGGRAQHDDITILTIKCTK